MFEVVQYADGRMLAWAYEPEHHVAGAQVHVPCYRSEGRDQKLVEETRVATRLPADFDPSKDSYHHFRIHDPSTMTPLPYKPHPITSDVSGCVYEVLEAKERNGRVKHWAIAPGQNGKVNVWYRNDQTEGNWVFNCLTGSMSNRIKAKESRGYSRTQKVLDLKALLSL